MNEETLGLEFLHAHLRTFTRGISPEGTYLRVLTRTSSLNNLVTRGLTYLKPLTRVSSPLPSHAHPHQKPTTRPAIYAAKTPVSTASSSTAPNLRQQSLRNPSLPPTRIPQNVPGSTSSAGASSLSSAAWPGCSRSRNMATSTILRILWAMSAKTGSATDTPCRKRFCHVVQSEWPR